MGKDVQKSQKISALEWTEELKHFPDFLFAMISGAEVVVNMARSAAAAHGQRVQL